MPEAVNLPEFKPNSDLNEQLLNNLRIMAVAQEKNLAMRIPVISVSGHVDSGKSTTTALMLKELGVISESVIENLQQEARAKADNENQTFNDLNVNVAKLVEKGKEAQNRGMTIETNVHRVLVPMKLTVPAGSEKHTEACDLLKKLSIEFVENKDGANVNIEYKTKADIVDCPGHKSYVHNTAMAIGECDIQILLFPNNGGEDDATFLKMVGIESLSMAHAQLGVTSGKVLILCLSKSELGFSKVNERINIVRDAVKKKCGVPLEKLAMVPITNKGLACHNVVKPTTMKELTDQFKGTEVKLMVPDYKDTTTKFELKAKLSCVFDAVRYFPPVISHTGLFNNRGALLSVSTVASTAHGRVLVCVVLNGAIKNGSTVISTMHKQKLTITSMEQFKKSVDVSATGSHIGIKVKAEDRKFDSNKLLAAGDLLYCDYPADNEPQCTSYVKAKIVYSKTRSKGVAGQKAPKEITRKIGSSPLLILGRRESVSIVHIYAVKEGGKKEEVKSTPEAPITTWGNGVVITALVKFSKPTCLCTITQSQMHSQGSVLEHHDQVGSLKIVEHVSSEEGEQLDQVLAAQKAKEASKKRPGKK